MTTTSSAPERTSLSPARREKMIVETSRLEQELASLEAEWERLPRFFWVALIALPAAYGWGALGFVLALLGAGAFVGTAAYLLYVRRREAEGDMALLKHDLAEPPNVR